MSDAFKAIADPTRRGILLMLAEQPAHVNTIAEKFNMSRPGVSKHLKVLIESKLVKMETDGVDGRQRNCYAQLEALQEVEEFLTKLEAFWSDRLDGLGAYLKQIKSKDKEQ